MCSVHLEARRRRLREQERDHSWSTPANIRALVTGGAGFIGSHVVDAYVQAGLDVAIVDNLATGSRANLNSAARLYEVDIRDGAELDRVFADERPAIVSHQAAQASVRGSMEDPLRDAATNVLGSLNVLEACSEGRGSEADLRRDRRRSRGRAEVPAGRRGSPGRAAKPVRRQQARRRALRVALPADVRSRHDDLAVHEHLRPAPGSAEARPA